MGHQISSMFNGLGRFFEYPVKRKPICFYRQEDFTATGEPRRKTSDSQKAPVTDYDKLVDLFYKRLAEQRQYNAEMKEKDRRWSMQKVVERFPGWNEVTIANLHSLFLLFDNQSNGMLGFDDFSAVLESLGDESSMEFRKEKFHGADADNDGWITYDEFLSTYGYIFLAVWLGSRTTDHVGSSFHDFALAHLIQRITSDVKTFLSGSSAHPDSYDGTLVYNFNPQHEGDHLNGLALLCNEVAENIQFVSNLTVGEQLEYGLF